MKTKQILSFMLCCAMLFSAFPRFAFAAEKKDERTVYLHAQGENPAEEAVNSSTVYMGDTADIYLAVDNPNKGSFENNEHKEPQYDMNGYTVKIYFNPEYFDYAADNVMTPIDYTVPDSMITDSGNDTEHTGSGEIDAPQNVGYYAYRHGSGTATIEGNAYKTAFATIFVNGTYFPQMAEGQNWYNLLKLPLRPLKTGNTEVFIDVDGFDDFRLELFAKNVSDKYEEQFFNYSAVNGGRHTILIRDRQKPVSPTAVPRPGRYTQKQSVTLSAAEDNCDIFYSTDGTFFDMYDAPIEVEFTTTISAYTVRNSDGKKSNTVNFDYSIVPVAPYLFDSEKSLIPNSYNKSSGYTLYVSDKNIFGDIEDGSEVYYTFARLDENSALGGSNPEAEWVAVNKSNPVINIDKNRTVRLITDKMGDLSDISEYYLGIKPAKVTATPASGIFTEKQDIRLYCETENAIIYYTSDGSNPITDGLEYDETKPITLADDTVIRAVSYFDGQYSDVSAFSYMFDFYDDYGVTAFYPSGVYEGSVDVTLTANNPENEIRYSLDNGENWVTGDTLHIEKDTDVLVRSIDKLGNAGADYGFTYKIKPLAPAFAPEGTQFTNADKITVFCVESTADNTSRYDLYYTTDGSDPTDSLNTARVKANADSDTATIDINRYTQVKAAVLKDGERYSNVVTHSYDIVTIKPTRPITTLISGHYTREIEDEDGFFTQFMPVSKGTDIYYTISYDDGFLADPVPNTPETLKYSAADNIEIKGKTTIKAVAVNLFGVKSDIGIFEYVIAPDAPRTAPSTAVYGDTLPEIPVTAVKGSDVVYSINGGSPVTITDCTGELTVDLSEYGDNAELEIYSVLDGVESYKNTYVYSLTNDASHIAAPYADKRTGKYEEIRIDDDNNLLYVNLYSLNTSGDIEYRINNEGEWIEYHGSSIELKEDTVLQTRAVNGTGTSTVVSYVYNFVPLAPVITLPSGRYVSSQNWETYIKYDERIPTDKNYNIFYRHNGDLSDVRYILNMPRGIDHTMSFKAYVKNEETGKLSDNTINYYIIEADNVATGTVYVANPYDRTRVAANELNTGAYADGIKLLSQNNNAEIHYYYSYTKTDGTQATTNNYVYDAAAPIMVNESFKDITIYAWLEDADGKIIDSDSNHKISFIHLSTPTTSLGTKIEHPVDTAYTLINDYPTDDNIILYYTLDKSDPTDKENTNRRIYDGESLSVKGETNINAVYYSACGSCVACKGDDKENCWNSVYGKIGSYRYTNPTVISRSGGGGGGGGRGYTPIPVADNNTVKNRAYTKDIFGTHHPTHIGYINGYPDGSVKPDGYITREEITAILYRIKNKEYESPFIATGEVFPDVASSRWSVTEIEYMASHNVVAGYPDGEFKPSRNLTRAEFSALVRRFAGLSSSSDENHYIDLESTHWAYDDILMLSEAGLVQGYEDNTFRPEQEITRAEVMTAINKLLGRCPDPAYAEKLNFNPFNDLNKDAWYYMNVLEATITHDYYLNDRQALEIEWENWK